MYHDVNQKNVDTKKEGRSMCFNPPTASDSAWLGAVLSGESVSITAGRCRGPPTYEEEQQEMPATGHDQGSTDNDTPKSADFPPARVKNAELRTRRDDVARLEKTLEEIKAMIQRNRAQTSVDSSVLQHQLDELKNIVAKQNDERNASLSHVTRLEKEIQELKDSKRKTNDSSSQK
jgi:hypothetical protein